jgi:voltage-gated potassium channel
VHDQLDVRSRPGRGLSLANRVLVCAIIAAVLSGILQTEPVVATGREATFRVLELGFGALFAIEYLARLWSCVEAPRFSRPFGRLRWALSAGALLDLLVVVVSLAPLHAGGLLSLRLLRVVSLVRFARLGRFSRATLHLLEAVQARRYELFVTVVLALMLIVLGASAMWAAEGAHQPEKFGSIPRAMWWAAVTLTTIGYGDVYPVTTLGKAIAVLVAIAGIGLIAMPTGILAAAFSDALQRASQFELDADSGA